MGKREIFSGALFYKILRGVTFARPRHERTFVSKKLRANHEILRAAYKKFAWSIMSKKMVKVNFKFDYLNQVIIAM